MDAGSTNSEREPSRDEIDHLPGPVLLEFGASWCGHCQALQPHLENLLKQCPSVNYLWIEDGKGKPLGRSFKVKLWPTLVFLQSGHVLKQVSRPDIVEVREGLEMIARIE